MSITAIMIKELRERTGAGIMECKKALIAANGDIELAVDNMRRFGQSKAAKKAVRLAKEGIILIKISNSAKYGVIVELNCETDFVANNVDFKYFGYEVISLAMDEHIYNIENLKNICEEKRSILVNKIGENIQIRRIGFMEGDFVSYYLHGTRIGVIVSAKVKDEDKELIKHVAMHIAASNPIYINAKDVPVDIVSRERKIQLDIAMQSNKQHTIVEKIVEGRMSKFIDEISLNNQYFILDQSKKVGKILYEKNAIINNFIRFEVGEGL